MPAGSERGPASGRLPQTIRPYGVRIAVWLLTGLLLVTAAVVWVAFPQDVRDKFTLFQRGTLVVFGIAAVVSATALGRSRVEAREDGLTVVNGYRSRRYRWEEVDGVSLRAGNPWASLRLRDGSTVPVMGIQGSDGDRAVAAARRLAALVKDSRSTG